MSRSPAFIALATLVLTLAGCQRESTPRDYFSAHKAGQSPDFAVIKWGDPTDHVATVHGLVDDLNGCQLIVEALNKDACSETDGQNCLNPFSCRPLNS